MKRLPKIEVFEGRATDAWYWRLRAGNGEIQCTGEPHTRRRDARRAARAARRNMLIAMIVDVFRD